jgi:hypothetical protein
MKARSVEASGRRKYSSDQKKRCEYRITDRGWGRNFRTLMSGSSYVVYTGINIDIDITSATKGYMFLEYSLRPKKIIFLDLLEIKQF